MRELIGFWSVGDGSNIDNVCQCGCGTALDGYNTFEGKILSHLSESETDDWAHKTAEMLVSAVRDHLMVCRPSYLTEDEVRRIRRLAGWGWSYDRIAEELRITKRKVSQVVRRVTYKNVT